MLEKQLTEEDISNMSPEQIIELQKQQCIFCKIIKGDIPSKKVYEDEICLVILDINPANPGHMLLLPKNHYTIMPQIPENEIKHIAVVIKHLSQAALKAFGAQGTNIFIANGAIAGQRAPHFMVHIIPRKDNDEIEGFTIPEHKINEKDTEKIQNMILEKISAKTEEKEEIKEKETKKEKKSAEEESKPKKNEEKQTKGAESPVDIDLLAKMFKK